MFDQQIEPVIYDEFKKNIKTGDIFGWGNGKTISKVIRYATRAKVSHVGIFVWWGEVLMVVDATFPKGVTVNPADTYLKEYRGKVFWGRPHRQEFSTNEIEDRARKHLGKKYDKWEAIISFMYKSKSEDKFFCSELVSDILGLDQLYLLSKKGITPVDIMNKCENQIRQLIFS